MAPSEKTFSADIVTALMAAFQKKSGTMTVDYKLMSALLGGKPTASALEHQFRAIKAAAAELLKDGGDAAAQQASESAKSKPSKTKGNSGDAESKPQQSSKTRKRAGPAEDAGDDDDAEKSKPPPKKRARTRGKAAAAKSEETIKREDADQDEDVATEIGKHRAFAAASTYNCTDTN